MKSLLLIALLLPITGQAQCYANNGGIYCTPDYRNDYNSPKIYTPDGEYRGNLNGNKYDSNSISNPYGRYGSKYSTESINNPYNIDNGFQVR
jgi:hypothetical protein